MALKIFVGRALYREENLPDKHRPALEALKAANLKVAKAWAMKEGLSGVWKYLSTGRGRRFVKRWLAWVNKSGLIQRHLENILTFCRHRLLLWRSGPLPSQLVVGVTHGKPGRADFY